MGQRIVVVNKDGYAYSFPKEKRDWALSHGYSPATEEEAKIFNEEMDIQGGAGLVKAVIRGAGRGASVGLSDVALALAGKAEETQRLKEAHPVGSVLGEALGFGAGLYATGFGNLLAGLGAKTVGITAAETAGKVAGTQAAKQLTGKILSREAAKQIAKKITATGITGAAEGAISGLSQAVSESALEDKEFMASSALLHMGEGAGAGLLLGTGAGAFEASLGAGGRALLNATEKARPGLENFARERALKAVGMLTGDLKKLKPRQKTQYADDLLNYKLKDDGLNVLQSGDRVKGTYERVVLAREELFQDLSDFRREISDFVDKTPDVQPKLNDLISKIDREIIDPLKDSKLPTTRAKANKVFAEFEDLRNLAERGENISLAELESIRQEMASNIYPKAPPGGGFARIVPEAQQELMQAERVFEQYISDITEKAAKKLGPGYAGRYKELKRLTNSFIKLSEAGEKGVAHLVGNRWLSPSDYGTGGMAAIATASQDGGLSIVTGLAAAGINKIIRERGSSIAARAAKNMMDSNYLINAVGKTNNLIRNTVKNFLHVGIPSAVNITHGALSHESTETNIQGRINALTDFVQNPMPQLERLSEKVEDTETATLMGSMALNGANFLLAKAPKDPSLPGIQPLLSNWTPPREAVAKWDRYYEAVKNPMGTIQDIGRGRISAEGVEVLKNVFPPLYDNVVKQMAAEAATMKNKLSYAQRVKLSILFGQPLDISLTPKNVKFYQQAYASKPASQPPPSAAGATAAKVSSAYLSHSDKVQQRFA